MSARAKTSCHVPSWNSTQYSLALSPPLHVMWGNKKKAREELRPLCSTMLAKAPSVS